MLKKLRLKFIGINMALVCLVLLIVFATLVYSTARQLEEDATAALELALRWEGRDDPRPFTFGLPNGNSDGRSRLIPVFCVTISPDGSLDELTLGSGDSVSDEVLEQAVKEALSSEADRGILEDLGLRFQIRTIRDNTRIAFSDMGWERSSLTRLILNSLLVGLASIVCFFLISLFLSRLGPAPGGTGLGTAKSVCGRRLPRIENPYHRHTGQHRHCSLPSQAAGGRQPKMAGIYSG